VYLGTIPLLAGGRRGSLSEVDGCGTGGGGGFLDGWAKSESESDPGASSEETEIRPAPLSLDSKTLFRHWGQILLVLTSQGSMHLAW